MKLVKHKWGPTSDQISFSLHQKLRGKVWARVKGAPSIQLYIQQDVMRVVTDPIYRPVYRHVRQKLEREWHG